MQIKEYKVLIANGTTDSDGAKKINEMVKQHLKEGWSLQGGISCIVTSLNNISFVQAIIMFEE